MILCTKMGAKGCHWLPVGPTLVLQRSQERVPKHAETMDREKKAFH